MGRTVDLVDDRRGEIRAGDVRAALGVEQRDVVADPEATGPLSRRPRAVRARWADEDPVQALGGLFGQQDAGRLPLQSLVAELLRDVPLDEARRARCRPQRAEAADLDVPRARLGGLSREPPVDIYKPSGHVSARRQRRHDSVGPRDDLPRNLVGGAGLVPDALDGLLGLGPAPPPPPPRTPPPPRDHPSLPRGRRCRRCSRCLRRRRSWPSGTPCVREDWLSLQPTSLAT